MALHRNRQSQLKDKIMRILIILVIILVGGVTIKCVAQSPPNKNDVNSSNIFAIAADMQGVYNSWDKGAPTNGIVCAISFAPSSWNGAPAFYVNLINTTTNYIRGILVIPLQNRAKIELLDSNGKAVSKTDEGKRFSVWTCLLYTSPSPRDRQKSRM